MRIEMRLRCLVWFGIVWYGLVWFAIFCYGLLCFGMVCYGLVWFDKGMGRGGGVCFEMFKYIPESSVRLQKVSWWVVVMVVCCNYSVYSGPDLLNLR